MRLDKKGNSFAMSVHLTVPFIYCSHLEKYVPLNIIFNGFALICTLKIIVALVHSALDIVLNMLSADSYYV